MERNNYYDKNSYFFSNSYMGKVLNGIDRLQVKRTEYLEKIGITHNIVSTLKKNIGKDNHILNYLFSSDYNIKE